jgi:hypothetical protein
MNNVLKGETEMDGNKVEMNKILVVMIEKEKVRGLVDSTGDSANSRKQVQRIDTALANALSQLGYKAITLDSPEVQKLCGQNEIDAIKYEGEQYGLRLARTIEADLFIRGETKFFQKKAKHAGEKSVTLTSETFTRAILVSPDKSFHEFRHSVQASHSTRQQAFSDCVDKISSRLATELTAKIQQHLGSR